MTLIVEAIATRIEGQVPALTGAVQYVADLAALIAAGALPQREVTAFVVGLGFDSSGGETISNAHRQMLDRGYGVVLAVKALGDAKAQKAVPKIDELEAALNTCLAGWAPAATVGVLVARRGRLVSIESGIVLYQLDYELKDQLRNLS